MPEWFSDFLVAIGGGAVALAGVLTLFKNLLIKFFEAGIGSSFEKNMEKYRNHLSRSTKAYEILLDKEISYYGTLDPHLATLVPLIQDLVHYSDMSNDMELSYRQTQYREQLLTFLRIIPKMKNESILFQPYVPEKVWVGVSHLLGVMQSNLDFWNQTGNIIFGKSEETIDLERAKDICSVVLIHIAAIQTAIKTRLDQLTM